MAKIDVYLRSIERFGASGAILSSGQAVTLRLPQGDRQATQVTPHDQLVALVREIAPPPALAQIDRNAPAKFDFESAGVHYALTVTPRQGGLQLLIEGAGAAPAARVAPVPVATPPGGVRIQPPRAVTAPAEVDPGEMAIERGQYGEAEIAGRTTSGSALLDQWTTAARSARATDVLIATGAAPVARVGSELQPIGDRGVLDAEMISRELGIVAPAEARAAWTEHGLATFTYGDGMGRVRATLSRDHRGPGAALRLLVGEPPALERLGMSREVGGWLDERGLVLVAGPPGSGKTTTLAALVRALADRRRRVIAFEDPIEIVHAGSPWVSQRAVGEHVPSIAQGVHAALHEGADAIVVGTISTPPVAQAVVDAVAAGALVLATIAAVGAAAAVDRLVDLMPHDRRDLTRSTLQHGLLGTISPVVKAGARSFEVVSGLSG
jgi:twitching motility protein PilT